MWGRRTQQGTPFSPRVYKVTPFGVPHLSQQLLYTCSQCPVTCPQGQQSSLLAQRLKPVDISDPTPCHRRFPLQGSPCASSRLFASAPPRTSDLVQSLLVAGGALGPQRQLSVPSRLCCPLPPRGARASDLESQHPCSAGWKTQSFPYLRFPHYLYLPVSAPLDVSQLRRVPQMPRAKNTREVTMKGTRRQRAPADGHTQGLAHRAQAVCLC